MSVGQQVQPLSPPPALLRLHQGLCFPGGEVSLLQGALRHCSLICIEAEFWLSAQPALCVL